MVLPTVNWVSSVVIFESPENSRLPGRALSRVNPLLHGPPIVVGAGLPAKRPAQTTHHSSLSAKSEAERAAAWPDAQRVVRGQDQGFFKGMNIVGWIGDNLKHGEVLS